MGNLENWETLTAPGSRAGIDVTQKTGFPSSPTYDGNHIYLFTKHLVPLLHPSGPWKLHAVVPLIFGNGSQ